MGAVAAWLSPVVLAALSARVVAGDAGVPVFVATVAAAPLVALLAAPRARAHPASGLGDVAVLAALTGVLAANLLVLAEVARLLGLAGRHGVMAGAALALLVVALPAGERCWRLATPIGATAVLLPLGLAVGSTEPPWTMWAHVASRPALAFDARSVSVTEGRLFGERTTLDFDEPHRVIAVSPATWRVVERDAARVAVREWRLGPGDALTLRPGDQLALDAETRVRFEAGLRVPGAPRSGVAWADRQRRPPLEALVAAVGVAVTLAGGALALAPAALPTSGPLAAPAVVVAFVVGATVWGLYGIALAPELALAPRALAPLTEVIARIVAPPWRQAVVGVVVAGVVVLFLGVALAARARFADLAREVAARVGRPAPAAAAVALGGAGVVAVAGALAARGGDPWRLFTWGLGVAATAAVAPRLAAAGARGGLVGAVTGVLAFAATTALVEHPALVAAPLAWIAARLARRR